VLVVENDSTDDTVERAREVLILVKTTQELFANLRERLVALHPYELPELIAVEIAD
jgi:periplasmic divalent cation tolerance protein